MGGIRLSLLVTSDSVLLYIETWYLRKQLLQLSNKRQEIYTCDLLVSFPDTFSLVPECLGIRLVTCAIVRIFIRATDEVYCYM